jgi:ABC-2 type transport system permease protein
VIACKDLRLLLRDPMALFWTLVFPVLFALFIGSVLSSSLSPHGARLSLGFVDADGSEPARRLRAELEREPSLKLERERDLAAARDAVARGASIAYVYLPPSHADTGELELGTDPSRASEAAMVKALVGTTVTKLRAPPGVQWVEPVKEVSAIRSDRGPSPVGLVFPAAIAWGLMGCAATFAVSLVSERTGGTLTRLRAAPMTRGTLLFGKALACAVACVVDALVLLVIARFGFGVRVESPVSLLVSLGALTACFVGLTMLLSTLGRSEQSVSGAGWATLLFLAMLGGAMVPVSVMPEWMQRLSEVSPIRWGILALEGALWRGLAPRELALPCGILAAVGIAGFVLGLRLTARQRA